MDVGVLNLQIRDDSEKAKEGLRDLAQVLKSVKEATGKNKLTSVANGIKKIVESVNNSDDAIKKIRELADSIEKLRGAGDGFKAPNLSALTRKTGEGMSKGIENAQDAIEKTNEIIRDVGGSFTEMKDQLQDETLADTMTAELKEIQEEAKKTQEAVKQVAEKPHRTPHQFALDMPYARPGTLMTGDDQEKLIERYKERMRVVEEYTRSQAEKMQKWQDLLAGESEQTRMAVSAQLGVDPTMFDKSIVKVEQLTEAARIARVQIAELFDVLNSRDTSTLNWSQGIDRMYNIGGPFKDASESAQVFIENATVVQQKIDEIVSTLNQPVSVNWADAIGQIMNIEGPVKSAEESMTAFMQEMQGDSEIASSFRQLNPELQSLCDEAMRTGRGVSSLTSDMTTLDGELKQKKRDLNNTKSAFNQLKDAIKNMFPGIRNLTSAFARLVKYRMMRAMIKEISEGFKEGVENVYHYSKAIGSNFSKSMDDAASSLLQMKNSIGAAVAPAIQSLIPILQTVVNWVITAVNYLNQFFALLRGQMSWTRATSATTKAFDDVKKSAKGAGAAMKDLLADWDELNIIQSESGGGGGGGTKAMTDYLNMFEEVYTFDNKVKGIVNFLKDNLNQIIGIIALAGAAIKAWQFSSAFTGTLSTVLGLISGVATVALEFSITTLFDKQYMKTGQVGWLVGDVLTMLLGGVLMNRILSTVLGGQYASLAIPITLAVSATANTVAILGATDVSALSEENVKLSVLDALKFGGVAGFLARHAGVSMAKSIGTGAVIATMTFGALIGIKASVNAVQSGVTDENIKAMALSSLTMGIGMAGLAKLTGATLLGAAGLGGITAGLAVATFAAVIGISAMLHAVEMQWGDIDLTQEQVQQYVGARMFTIDVPVTTNIINAQVKTTQEAREKIKGQVSSLLGTLNVIKLGLADTQDYETIKSDVSSLVETVKGYINDAKKAGKLTLQFTPTLAGSNKAEQKVWYTNYTSGWGTVEAEITKMGQRIGELFVEGEKGEILVKEPELLATLLEQMGRVTNAIASAQVNSKALADFQFGLGELSEGSFEEVISLYNQYRKDLTESHKQLITEQYTLQGELVAALFEIDPNGEDYKKAKADYEAMGANLSTALNDAVDKASAPGQTLIDEWLKSRFSGNIADRDSYIQGLLGDYVNFKDMFTENESPEEIAKGINDILREAISSSIIGGELFDEVAEGTDTSVFGLMTDSLKNQVIDALKESFDDETVKNVMQNLAPDFEEEITVAPVEHTQFDKSMTDMVDNFIKETNNYVETANRLLAARAAVSRSFGGAMGGSLTGGGGFGGAARFSYIAMHADGGFVRSGELFSANENGNVEMIGRYGKNTAVANNEQIVEGITRGVANGQEEQNSLLRRQNEILTRLLQKEFVAKVTASSGVGRVNSQSEAMYAKMRG